MNRARACYRHLLPGLALFLLAPSGCAQGGAPVVATDGHGSGAAAAAAPAPRWPLDLPARWLTSNFMEYRGGRYHAGLDFKTREQEGFPAFAVEDGSLERIRAGAGGYGRALYLRGDSGHTYVYAHLARFNDEVERLVAAEQARTGAWRVELDPAPGVLRVRRGDAVGLTGQSGTTGPHLHFEVRDASGRPVDPQAAGFAVRDTIPPVIRHVRALAASASTRLAGGASGSLLAVAGRGGAAAVPLRASGPVAFSARVVEATDPAGHRLEPWRLLLLLDGVEACRRDNESFDFADNTRQRLEWLETGGLREQWLHHEPGGPVPGRHGGRWYLGPEGAGLDPGLHHLELVAIDRAGNRSSFAWDLEVLPPGAEPGPAGAGWTPGGVQVELAGDDGAPIVLAPLFEVVPPAAADRVQRLEPARHPGLLAPLVLAGGVVRALDPAQVAAAGRQGLAACGGQASWLAAAWPVAGEVVVDLPAGMAPAADTPAAADGGAGLPAGAIYRWDDGAWSPAGPVLAPAAPGGSQRFGLAYPGTYAALSDTLAPAVDATPLRALAHPGWGPPVPGLTPPRWQALAVTVRDAGSGVDAASLRARWDGQAIIVEPDLLRDRVLVPVPDGAGAGAHVLEIEAADRAGHAVAVTIAVQCDGGD